MVSVLPGLQNLRVLFLSCIIQRDGHQYLRDGLNSSYLVDEDLCIITGALESYPPPHLTPKFSLVRYLLHGVFMP